MRQDKTIMNLGKKETALGNNEGVDSNVKFINGQMATEEMVLEMFKDLVYNISHKFLSAANQNGMTFDDVSQIGFLGLVHSFRRFDESLGFQFSTFATRTINGYIMDSLSHSGYRPKLSKKVGRAQKKIISENWELLSVQEIVARSGIEFSVVVEALETIKNNVVMTTDVNMDSDSDTNFTFEIESTEYEYDNIEIMDELNAILTGQEMDFLTLCIADVNQTDIAKALNVSQSTISRILASVKTKIIQKYKDEGKLNDARHLTRLL